MNILFVTDWNDNVTGHNSKLFRDEVSKDHNVFIFHKFKKTNKEWSNKFVFLNNSDTEINFEYLLNKVRKNYIHTIVWLTDHDIELIKKLKECGISNINYGKQIDDIYDFIFDNNNSKQLFNVINESSLKYEISKVKKIRNKILELKRPLRVAHFSVFAPNASGMYESTKDIVVSETLLGINAGFVNTLVENGKVEFGVYHDDGIITKTLDWCLDADIFVLHSKIPDQLKDLGIPTIFINHGEPYYCYLTQQYLDNLKDLKIRSSETTKLEINGEVMPATYKKDILYKTKMPENKPYLQMMEYLKDSKIKACVTLWPEHKDYLDAVGYPHKNYVVQCPVDLGDFNPNVKPLERFEKDKFNIVFTDIWRMTKDPFNIIHAFRKFLKDVPNSFLFCFGFSKEYEDFWTKFYSTLDIKDKCRLFHITKHLTNVYAGADMLVTTRFFSTRTIREAMACGVPVVAGGHNLTPYNCSPESPESIYNAMIKCYKDIQKQGREKIRNKFRDIAIKNFNFVDTGKQMVDVIYNISLFHKKRNIVNCIVEDIKKPRIHIVSKYKQNKHYGFENRIIEELREHQYPLLLTDYMKDKDYIDQIKNSTADIMLVCKGNGSGLTYQTLNNFKGKKVLWFPDELVDWRHHDDDLKLHCSAYDIVYQMQDNDFAHNKLRELGAKDVRFLPLGAGKHLHKWVKECKDKTYDVSFLSFMYDKRIQFIDSLRKKAPDISIFNPRDRNHILTENYVEVNNKSKIVLNMGYNNYSHTYRVWEALGCGSFLLTNRNLDKTDYLIDKKHCVYYDNEEHCIELMRYYLTHDDERNEIAYNGWKEVNEKHLFIHRINKILSDLGYNNVK